MKYKVITSTQYNRDVVKLARALKDHSNMAKRIFQELERKLDGLEDNPFAYPVFRESKYRRVNLEDNALFYTVDETRREVKLYHLYYAKRDIDKLLGIDR